jgi:uncharacterized protein (TIGR02391 family)
VDWLPGADELLVLPVEDVAIFLLKRIARRSNQSWRAERFTGEKGEVLAQGPEYRQPEVVRALGEAWDWLFLNGLISGDPNKRDQGFFRISRKGLDVAQEAEPLRLLRADRLLAVPLHPAIDRKARLFFGIGEYEAAVLMAFRELEIRVRAAGPFDPDDLGPALMRKAFAPNKPGSLADPELLPAEQQAISDLYAGGMGAFKNPLSHRTVDYADPTIAAEQFLLADLLHRMLDGFVMARDERQAMT